MMNALDSAIVFFCVLVTGSLFVRWFLLCSDLSIERRDVALLRLYKKRHTDVVFIVGGALGHGFNADFTMATRITIPAQKSKASLP
ncbi:hypothetical protein HA466_0107280 [Hirschfeldia incana]|nr:hypothetical protein HA466_0107280 [Hirschfeldia incana]